MSEEVEPRSAPAVVQLALRQDAQQGRLPRVHIPQDGDPQVQELCQNHMREGERSDFFSPLELDSSGLI